MASWLAIALGGAFAGVSAWEAWRSLRARRWPRARGRVLEAGARERRSRGTRWVPAVRYEYAVGGARHEGTRLGYGWDRLYGSPAAAERALGPLRAGDEVEVHYDPRRPADSVLRPRVQRASLVLLAAGVAVMILGARA